MKTIVLVIFVIVTICLVGLIILGIMTLWDLRNYLKGKSKGQ